MAFDECVVKLNQVLGTKTGAEADRLAQCIGLLRTAYDRHWAGDPRWHAAIGLHSSVAHDLVEALRGEPGWGVDGAWRCGLYHLMATTADVMKAHNW